MRKGAVVSPFHKLVCIKSPEEMVGDDEREIRGTEGEKSQRGQAANYRHCHLGLWDRLCHSCPLGEAYIINASVYIVPAFPCF